MKNPQALLSNQWWKTLHDYLGLSVKLCQVLIPKSGAASRVKCFLRKSSFYVLLVFIHSFQDFVAFSWENDESLINVKQSQDRLWKYVKCNLLLPSHLLKIHIWYLDSHLPNLELLFTHILTKLNILLLKLIRIDLFKFLSMIRLWFLIKL